MDKISQCLKPKCKGEVETINEHVVCCTTCHQEYGYCTACGEWQPMEVLQGRPMSVVKAQGGYECEHGCEDRGFVY